MNTKLLALLLGSAMAIVVCFSVGPLVSQHRRAHEEYTPPFHNTPSVLNQLDLNRLPVETDPDRSSNCRVMLVTLDTVRADHLSAYGYPLPTTPFLEQFAAKATLYRNAYSPMATTVPAHASMLSGLYPIQHGITRNGHATSDALLTLPEVLSQGTIESAAFVGINRHFGPGNLAQGFGEFDEPEDSEYGDDPISTYRDGAMTLEHASDWLAGRGAERSGFVWLHLFDAHRPYVLHPQEAETLFRSGTSEESWRAYLQEEQGIPADYDEVADWVRRYDSEIRYLDGLLRGFFERHADWLKDALVIITSDHGEGFGNHGLFGHSKQIYNAQIRVPLLIRWPGRSSGEKVDEVVELNDLMPTIIDYCGIGRDALVARTHPLEGESLRPDPQSGALDGQFGWALAQRRTYHPRTLPRYLVWRLARGLGGHPGFYPPRNRLEYPRWKLAKMLGRGLTYRQ